MQTNIYHSVPEIKSKDLFPSVAFALSLLQTSRQLLFVLYLDDMFHAVDDIPSHFLEARVLAARV